jgi:glycosyltransferase involved in cell wall biosynthesis
MQALDHDPGLRAAMGRAARARAESAHSLDRHGRELLRIYDEVTPGGRA